MTSPPQQPPMPSSTGMINVSGKAAATKRLASSTTNEDLSNLDNDNNSSFMSLSDVENVNPYNHENKRPHLQTSAPLQASGAFSKPIPQNRQQQQQQQRTPLTTLNNNPNQICNKTNKSEIKPLKDVYLDQKSLPVPSIVYKRSCQLKLKPKNSQKLVETIDPTTKINENDNNISTRTYSLIEKFSQTATTLSDFHRPPIHLKTLEIKDLNSKMIDFHLYLNCLCDKFQSSDNERIEAVANQLNCELLNSIDLCLQFLRNDNKINNEFDPKTLPVVNDNETLKTTTTTTTTEMNNNIYLVDLLCTNYELSFSLFLYRVNLNIQLIAKQKQKDDNSKKNRLKLSPILIDLKRKLFTLISSLIRSINFNNSNITTLNSRMKKYNNNNNNNNNNEKSDHYSKGAPSTSYSALKVINVILNTFNRLIYLTLRNLEKVDYCNQKVLFIF
jgi:hypothetical protein